MDVELSALELGKHDRVTLALDFVELPGLIPRHVVRDAPQGLANSNVPDQFFSASPAAAAAPPDSFSTASMTASMPSSPRR